MLKMNSKELTSRGLEVESLLHDGKYEDIAFHLVHFETAEVSVEILQQTDIVRVVYRVFKSCPQGALKKKAKYLLSKWKNMYRKSSLQATYMHEESSTCEDKAESEGVATTSKNVEIPNLHSHNDVQKHENINLECNAQEHCSDQPKPVDYLPQKKVCVEDLALRTKCADLLCKTLLEHSESQQKAHDLAREIEENIYSLHAGNDKKYRNCIRSKISNLKNSNNQHLKHQLFSGDLSPKTFAQMNSMEMAGEELRKLRASYTRSGVQEHQLPQTVDGIQTNKIKCRKCENFNCTVTVISRGTLFLPGWVRSGNPDEEMITFVICKNCGEKWYHNKWVCL
ncbi:LOW QUALITY PROTEIN: transcription elongation factor A N-terminal and central domain-containing protein [Pelodytes ibericus]